MYRLTNPWMNYAWGSVDLLPALMGIRPDGRPVAEIWMGAHTAAPSSIEIGGHDVSLNDFIRRGPEQTLGDETMKRFGPHLPFMMKFLAADTPLSLQVHPTLEQAEEGYRREAAAGIKPTDPTRNYRDSAHKPEMLYALTPFEMMCGFRPVNVIRELLEGLHVDGLDPILERLDRPGPADALRSALTELLTADAGHQRSVTQAVVSSAQARSEQRPEYLLLCELAEHYPNDTGTVASLLLDYLRIQPGEAVFIGAGMLHSYVRGLGVELMATSDNVLRAGLTSKHVDVNEVLRLVSFVPGAPQLLHPTHVGDTSSYIPPVPDFALWTYTPRSGPDDGAGTTVEGPPTGARIAVCCAGRTTLTRQAERVDLERGQAAFIPHTDGPFDIASTGTVAVAYNRH